MNEQIKADEKSLRAFQVLCDLCSTLLYAAPTEESLAALVERRPLLEEEPFSTVAPEASRAIAATLGKADSPAHADELLHELRQDYTFLFYQVPLSHASPYESVYRTEDHTLFGPTTLEVRDAYARHGLGIASDESQPDDHIALELAFVAQLLGRAADAGGAADADSLDAARRFLSEHLLVFAPVYLDTVSAQARTPFYRATAQLAQNTLDVLSHALGARADA